MAQKTKSKNVREDFLRIFLFSLIKNSYIPGPQQNLQQVTETESKNNTLIEIDSIKTRNIMPIQNKTLSARPTQQIRAQFAPPLKNNLMSKMINPQNQQKFIPQLPPPTNTRTALNLGKIAQIISDPAVIGVECPGTGKNIIVNRSGAIKTTSITLTKEEIDSIMQEISEKTRIPIIPGIFKAAINDLAVTAVVSEFVGTRFVIQKRNPFTKY